MFGAGIAATKRIWDFRGVNAAGLGQRHRFGQDCKAVQDEYLIDHFRNLSAADRAHMGSFLPNPRDGEEHA